MKFYMVGGAVRDEILGVKSKDIDYTVVLDDGDLINEFEDPFIAMKAGLVERGFEIFLETPEYLTVRAKFPRGHKNENLTADFVLARKESGYSDGRRPDKVVLGTLLDDLSRRDFTMNAIAKDESGNLIDPFGGVEDTRAGIIRAVGSPLERLKEDALRAVRALRFSVTKRVKSDGVDWGFVIEGRLSMAMEQTDVLSHIEKDISDERIREELSKMFRHDTIRSLSMLSEFPFLTEAMFSGSVSLDATMKTKGRGR